MGANYTMATTKQLYQRKSLIWHKRNTKRNAWYCAYIKIILWPGFSTARSVILLLVPKHISVSFSLIVFGIPIIYLLGRFIQLIFLNEQPIPEVMLQTYCFIRYKQEIGKIARYGLDRTSDIFLCMIRISHHFSSELRQDRYFPISDNQYRNHVITRVLH